MTSARPVHDSLIIGLEFVRSRPPSSAAVVLDRAAQTGVEGELGPFRQAIAREIASRYGIHRR